jgi:hypothetical protein
MAVTEDSFDKIRARAGDSRALRRLRRRNKKAGKLIEREMRRLRKKR